MCERNESQSWGAWFKAESERYGGVTGCGLRACLQVIVLLAENEGTLQRIVDEFDRMCKRRKLRVNAGKSKVVVLERTREQREILQSHSELELRVKRRVGLG